MNDAVVAVPEVVKIGVEPPSSCSFQVIVPLVALVSLIPTVTGPLTVAPSAGLVMDGVSGPATVTLRVAIAEDPLLGS